jgi:hypothetical protein
METKVVAARKSEAAGEGMELAEELAGMGREEAVEEKEKRSEGRGFLEALLEEENQRLKEEFQRLRLELYGIKPSKKKKQRKKEGDGGGEDPRQEPKKRGPPHGS